MTAYLEKLGHRVYPFADPEDLLTVSQGVRPKAIIIDLVFQDGIVEGARIIKKVQRHQESPVPVIFTSFRDDVQARVLAAGAKGTYFFKKPIDRDRLLLTLDRIAFKPQSFNARVLLVNSHLARGDKQLEAFQKSEVETMLLRDPLQLFDAMGQYKPDQIVIDTAQLNSFQLVRAVRQHEAYQDIPITILSAVPFDAGALLAAEAGADTLIPSSISPDHMVRILKARTERIKSTVPEATIWEG
jgi:DNA-binding response OmpR family regulator